MPDSDHRDKMISLRLSQVEYDVLKMHYRTYGARNISELTRLALQRILAGLDGQQDGFAAKLSALDERIRQVESQVSLLLERESVTS